MEQGKIRQPIVTVVGHVDHGKTSILDCLRGTSVTAKEAGGITQEISFTLYPISQLKSTFPIVEKSIKDLKIPGFLFIDTPGHAAFINLRKRGGNLADIAILVIDINEGIKPQTNENYLNSLKNLAEKMKTLHGNLESTAVEIRERARAEANEAIRHIIQTYLGIGSGEQK